MVIDIHAHYVPSGAQTVVADIGQGHNLKLQQNERRRDLVTRDGKVFLGPLKIQFYDLDDAGFDLFWEAAQSLDALVFVHPRRVVGADHVVLGSDYPLGMATRSRWKR
jgi:hypothetical protein